MSASLLMQLVGPLQAWGDDSRFRIRTTRSTPTKSGVIGLIAAAEGRPRDAEIHDLAALRFGVRIDQPGTRLIDFHTAHWHGEAKPPAVSRRHYLADAKFVVCVEGPISVIERITDALRSPIYPPYLGRRSCVPATDLVIDIAQAPLEQRLNEAQWIAAPHTRRSLPRAHHLDAYIDAPPGRNTERASDLPLSFSPEHRQYAPRSYTHVSIPITNPEGTDSGSEGSSWYHAVEEANHALQ